MEWNHASGAMDPWGGSPLEDLENAKKSARVLRETDGDQVARRTNLAQDTSGPHLIPAPGSPAQSCSASIISLSSRSAPTPVPILR